MAEKNIQQPLITCQKVNNDTIELLILAKTTKGKNAASKRN